MAENWTQYLAVSAATKDDLKRLFLEVLRSVIGLHPRTARRITDPEFDYICSILVAYRAGNLNLTAVAEKTCENDLDVPKMLFVADATLILTGYFGHRGYGRQSLSEYPTYLARNFYRRLTCDTGFPVYDKLATNFSDWQALLQELRCSLDEAASLRYLLRLS